MIFFEVPSSLRMLEVQSNDHAYSSARCMAVTMNVGTVSLLGMGRQGWCLIPGRGPWPVPAGCLGEVVFLIEAWKNWWWGGVGWAGAVIIILVLSTSLFSVS